MSPQSGLFFAAAEAGPSDSDWPLTANTQEKDGCNFTDGDGLYKRAAEITGLSESALQTYKSMADSFQLCLRKQELGFSHHREAASIKQIATDADGRLYGLRSRKFVTTL